MVFLIILTVFLAIYGGWVTRKWLDLIKMQRQLEKAEKQLEERTQEVQRLRAVRQDLERICNGRGAEIRRLRAQEARHVAEIRELEEKASELNVSMFRESGLRILAEKEDSAKRLKVELLEKQLAEARRLLKEGEAQAQSAEAMYQSIIADRDGEIARLQASHGRRSRARNRSLENQISVEEILKDEGGQRRGRHREPEDS